MHIDHRLLIHLHFTPPIIYFQFLTTPKPYSPNFVCENIHCHQIYFV